MHPARGRPNGSVPSSVSSAASALYRVSLHTGLVLWRLAAEDGAATSYTDAALARIWHRIPAEWQHSSVGLAYGRFLHHRASRNQQRLPEATSTFFLRNEPQLAVLRDLVVAWPAERPLRVASIACSSGAELYSMLWTLRTARPDLCITGVGMDLSAEAVARARAARYHRADRELARIDDERLARLCGPGGLFAAEDDALVVRPEVRANTRWLVSDALDPALSFNLGLQDIVLANNILCHLADDVVESCFHNLARLLAPGAVLGTYGVDLDVKTRCVRAIGLRPLPSRVAEAYEADQAAQHAWPLIYWGREPFDPRRPDWLERYASVYTVPG
jgi:chemotaxis methyl-accepting protein methylase